jgi:hypothetical protein
VWTLDASAEIGAVFDDTTDPATGSKNYSFDRTALSGSAIYRGEGGVDGKLRGEVRFDDSENDARDRTAYLASAGLGVKVSEDWRALTAVDTVIATATDTTLAGEYAEGSIGFAYRPVANDRFNGLFKIIGLYDKPGKDQVTVDGTTNGPYQMSGIASADINYDLIKELTVGAKYGVRIGQSKERKAGSDWESSTAHLGVLRADLNIVNNWDALVEARMLWLPDTDTSQFGAVAAIYRHLGENAKIGIGYNFGSFSDDLRDLTLNDQGIFVNLLGKW